MTAISTLSVRSIYSCRQNSYAILKMHSDYDCDKQLAWASISMNTDK